MEMQAIQIAETGDLDVIKQVSVPVPVCGPKQVVIRAEIAGVNYIDIYFRTGLYASELPKILGQEVGGKILEVGQEVEGLAVGDTVVAITGNAMAERVAVEAKLVVKVPERVSLRSCTALLLQGLTACTLTHTAYQVRSGDRVLVHAAAGGTGLLLVQVAKALGAMVIGTTSTQEKADIVREHGADHVLLYGEGNASAMENADQVLKLTDGKGVEVVYDSVGQATWDANFHAVARLGTLVSFGQSSGKPEDLALARLGAKNLRVLRPTLFNYLDTQQDTQYYAGILFDMVAQGKECKTRNET
ncbi:NADPH:quinone reductase [Malassezia yamatoensis]|uniref:Probable quinone oxidoreductase n=1 Tax=Malassezia yamatoensis TaxID=253288 RepID=A0AAJ5YWY6_9BASI|nr:NADPH:quinone reductase [Malassezia yamatoensis]